MKLNRLLGALLCAFAVVSCSDKNADLPVQGSIDENGNYTATFTAERNYLLIPSVYKMGRSSLDIKVDGTSIFQAIPTMTVATDVVNYFVPVDIAPYRGKELEISISRVAAESPILTQARQSNDMGFDKDEFYRPQYHFAPVFGWNNDPNGMFYHDGVWHLGYQHNPYSVMWGNMSWGHATSTDLIHWQDHPVIIRPDELGTAFSGSAVVDVNNTAGFGAGAVVALYTSAGSAGQQQSIAYSLDGGYTYKKYEGNPVITSTPQMRSQRDPKVQWIDDKWVMAISFDKYIRFYASQNLKDWEYLSAFECPSYIPKWGTWECPDLIKMDYKGQTKWVATINADQSGPNGVRTTLYFIGQWTGTEFIADPIEEPMLLDYGVDQYAGVTFGGTGDRHVQLAWLTSSPFPGSETPATKYFTGGMALPHDIFLKEGKDHPVLASVPAKEVYAARKEGKTLGLSGAGKIESILENNTGSYELELCFVPGSESSVFGFNLTNSKGEIVTYTFDMAAGQMLTDRSKCGLQDAFPKSAACPVVAPLEKKESYKVELFIDRMTSEMFVGDGDLVMTNCLFPTEYLNTLEVFGDVTLSSSMIYEFE